MQTQAGLYLRISKVDSTTVAVDRQEAECRAKAQTLGFKIIKVYVDQGKSDSNPRVSRNLYQQMLADAHNGVIQGLMPGRSTVDQTAGRTDCLA